MSTEGQTTTPPSAPADVELGADQLVVPPSVRRTRRRRRPSGAPPPLPRSLGVTGKGWLLALGLLVAWVLITLLSSWARRVTDRVDAAIIRAIVSLRVEWLSDLLRGVNRVSIGWTVTVVALALLVTLVVFRRWRHLFTFLASVAVAEILGKALLDGFARPRPYEVTIIDRWKGFSLPSPPVAVITVLLVAILYTIVVPGRPRTIAKAAVAGGIAVLCFARIYLGVDHPFDDLVAVAMFVAIPLNAFRFFTPNEVFPVTYHRGKTAHLDVEGRRGQAIRDAVHDQLGVTVVDIKPVGLAGSGGSTPLRLRVAGDPDTYTFGKLYAMSHVRADRWYKLGRTILYGRLEDEAPFQSVRRLVEYEDYTLRLVRDAGIHTAAPMGIVEMTPEREYLLVTEFFDGAQEIGDAEVDDDLIDQGLMLVRQLWEAGLAHRDIKPANLLVRDGRLLLIDVAFAQVRPSPWRQAVDLANMMLVLAVRTDAERVYQRALRFFTPEEIGEAFAATRGVASPTQLRMAMKQDGRDLMARFRRLAPECRPISLQRWSVKRVLLALGLLLGAVLTTQIVYPLFVPAEPEASGKPTCGTNNLMILMAQSVPEATAVPCLASLPAGWTLDKVEVKAGRSRFWLNSDEGGWRAVAVTLQRPSACRVDEAVEVLSDEVGMRRYEQPERLPPELRTTRFYLLPGACVTYQFSFGAEADAALIFAADTALAFQPREPLADEVAEKTGGLRLCGAGGATLPGRDMSGRVLAVVATSFPEVTLRVLTAVVIAIVTTSLSLRLLGLRRGWPKALLAAALGWGTAAFLALSLTHWDWGAEGLVVHTVAIGIPATMAAAVTLDLLARPGSLATGERAGLVLAPRPLRAVKRRIDVLLRYRELMRLARREGFGPLLSAGARVERSTEATGVRLRRLLEDAGGVSIKLGQIAATRVDLLPPELCAELAELQNRVRPEPTENIQEVLEAELAGSVDEVFAEFDWEPLAAASIGQTHRARLRSGEAVVVKVQRAGIDDVMERDLAALALLADFAQRRTTFGQGMRSGEVLDQFAHSLRAELDFRREADAMEEMATLLGNGSGVRVPTVHKELCTRRLLVQERFEGFTVADSEQLNGVADRPKLADQLLHSMLDQVMRIGVFHADPHPGNVFVFADGTLGLIDFGAVGRLDPIQQAAIVDILAALVSRDVSLLRDGVERVADMVETVPPERLERAFARLMAEHVRATGAVDPAVLQDLVATLSQFGIGLPGDLVILSRALVTLDGTLRTISPGFSMVAAATQLGPSSATPALDRDAMIRAELTAMLPHLRRLPDRIDRILMLTGRGDLRLRTVVDEDSRRIVRTLVNRALLVAVGAAFLVVSAGMLLVPEKGPAVAADVGLYEILGYGGLLAGTVLLLRVVAAVTRDGTT